MKSNAHNTRKSPTWKNKVHLISYYMEQHQHHEAQRIHQTGKEYNFGKGLLLIIKQNLTGQSIIQNWKAYWTTAN